MKYLILLILFIASSVFGAIPNTSKLNEISEAEKLKLKLKELTLSNNTSQSNALIFDLPMTYNKQVSKWVNYFQTKGSKWFRQWLERSSKYLPFIQKELQDANLPTDLAFMVMIESGFSPTAVSVADAVGPWQFIEGTAQRYGLKKNWWLDERRDFRKSTHAAIKYIKDLYNEFGSWYLVAASYNMGENGLRRQIEKHKTKDYWTLIQRNALPEETQNYVPKILAAMLITKAPNLYGFRSLEKREPLDYDYVKVPGGTDLNYLAEILGITKKSIKELNSELLIGYIPKSVNSHPIRVPSGAGKIISEYIAQKNNL